MAIWLVFLLFYAYIGLTREFTWRAFAVVEAIRFAVASAWFASQYEFDLFILALALVNTAIYATAFGLFYWIGGRRKREA